MKTSTHTSIRTAALLVLGILMAGSAIAASECEKKEKPDRRGDREERGGRGDREDHPWREEGRAFREKQREKIKSHMEAQREAGEAQREAVHEEEDPYKAVKMIKSYRTKTHKKNVKFFEGVHSETLAFLESMFAKYEVPEEKQTKILEEIEGRQAARRAEHEERFDKFIAVLDKLAAKEGLTKEDIRDAMKKLHGGRPGHGRGGRRGGGDRGGDRERGPRRGGDGDKGDKGDAA